MPTSSLRLLPRITGTPESAKKREPMLDPNGPVARAFSVFPLISSTVTSRHSRAIPESLEIRLDGRVEVVSLALLLAQRRSEPSHLLLKRLAVVLLRLGPDIAPRRYHVPVLPDVLQHSALAEPRHVRVSARLLLAPPRVVGPRDLCDVLLRQLAMRPVHHAAHLPCVNEEHLTTPVTEPAVLLVARQEPQTRRNLR